MIKNYINNNFLIIYTVIAIIYFIFFHIKPDRKNKIIYNYINNKYITRCCNYSHSTHFVKNESFPLISHLLIPNLICLFIMYNITSKNNGTRAEISTWINDSRVVNPSGASCNLHLYIIAFLINDLITQFIKIIKLSPRPDIVDRIKFIKNNVTKEEQNILHKINNQYLSHLLYDGYKSFISGHASISFATLTILSFMFLDNKDQLNTLNYLLSICILIFNLIYGSICSESRIIDNKHHTTDVLFGIIIGSIVPFFILK